MDDNNTSAFLLSSLGIYRAHRQDKVSFQPTAEPKPPQRNPRQRPSNRRSRNLVWTPTDSGVCIARRSASRSAFRDETLLFWRIGRLPLKYKNYIQFSPSCQTKKLYKAGSSPLSTEEGVGVRVAAHLCLTPWPPLRLRRGGMPEENSAPGIASLAVLRLVIARRVARVPAVIARRPKTDEAIS